MEDMKCPYQLGGSGQTLAILEAKHGEEKPQP